jgi:hypothetical protein
MDLYGRHISKERAQLYFNLHKFNFDCADKKCCAPSHFVGNIPEDELKEKGYCWECRHRNWVGHHAWNKEKSLSRIEPIDGSGYTMEPYISLANTIIQEAK